MKIIQTASFFLLTAGTVAFFGCNDDTTTTPQPKVLQTTNVVLQLGMSGYAASPNTVGRLGVAASPSDAQIGKGSELTGTITWAETKGGKEFKTFILPNRIIGTKYWVFLSTKQKPTATQSINVSWPVTGNASLTASAADTLVIKEMTVQ